MTSLEALHYLDDIAHGRKMIYDPHELEQIIEKELKALEIIKKRECLYKGLQEVSQKEYELLNEVGLL